MGVQFRLSGFQNVGDHDPATLNGLWTKVGDERYENGPWTMEKHLNPFFRRNSQGSMSGGCRTQWAICDSNGNLRFRDSPHRVYKTVAEAEAETLSGRTGMGWCIKRHDVVCHVTVKEVPGIEQET